MVHYVRDMVQRRVVELQFVPTDEQVANMLMKLLVRGKFEGFQKMLRVMDAHGVLGLEDLKQECIISFHDRRFKDREAIQNGARAADLDCEFISQTNF